MWSKYLSITHREKWRKRYILILQFIFLNQLIYEEKPYENNLQWDNAQVALKKSHFCLAPNLKNIHCSQFHQKL